MSDAQLLEVGFPRRYWLRLRRRFDPSCKDVDPEGSSMQPMRYAILPAMLLAACSATSSSTVQHKSDPGALGPYSSGVQLGDMVLLSGKIGERDQGFAHEVTTCIDRIEANLAEFGLGLEQVVEARVYLVDMNRYGEFNKLYGERFGAPFPVRTCVAVAALPAGAQVEIQVAAHRDSGR